jgi:hypothetical protein
VGVLGDDVADFAVLGARAAVLDGPHQALVGGLDQLFAVVVVVFVVRIVVVSGE